MCGTASIGIAKPEPDAFLAVTIALGVSPQGCGFVDDTVANVRSASALGMRAHHFRNARLLDGFLQHHAL